MSKAKLPTPHKLQSVGISRDDFETWWHFVKIYCQQNTDYTQFFPGGKFQAWTAETRDATRGITVVPNQAAPDPLAAAMAATEETTKTRLLLSSLLTTIAAFCPEGTFKPVLSESTSILWIHDRIAKVCKIQTTGRHLPKILNIKWEAEKDTPDAFFLKVKSAFQDSLMPAGTIYHGARLQAPETLGPLTESIIVIKWLEAIHPALPNYIMENRGDLFTDQAPNFCDIQPELCNIMDSLVAKVQETEYAASRISSQTQFGASRGTSPDPDIRFVRTNRYQPAQSRKPNQNTQRFGNQAKPKLSCDYCYTTGKEEKVWSTHTAQNCFSLFPEKRKPRVRMITIPVHTDENDDFSLEDAMDSLTDNYQNMSVIMDHTLEPQ